MQSKLLTAIEKRQISRLGSTQSVPIDVRLDLCDECRYRGNGG